jgi:hypothetical protein
VDRAATAESTDERTVALLAPTRAVLGLSERYPSASDVAAGALRLLEAGTDAHEAVPTQPIASLDEFVVGVVEVVEECVFSPPPDCPDVRARAEIEAARWVDDFLADYATDCASVAAQQMMFLLAQRLADTVAEALIQRASRSSPGIRLVEQLHRRVDVALRMMRIGGIARCFSQLPAPCRLRRG